MDKVLAMIEIGIKEGGKLETGGKRHGTTGFFIQPTVFSNVLDHMTIAQEEVGLYCFKYHVWMWKTQLFFLDFWPSSMHIQI